MRFFLRQCLRKWLEAAGAQSHQHASAEHLARTEFIRGLVENVDLENRFGNFCVTIRPWMARLLAGGSLRPLVSLLVQFSNYLACQT